MYVRLGLFAALVLALLVAAVPAHAAKRRVPQGFYGVMWDRAGTDAQEGDQDAQMALMARSGVESVRTVFSWGAAQPEPGSAPDLRETDALVARATRRGLRVLPVVMNTPTWARKYPDRPGSPPRLASDYTAYLRALVLRYGPGGSFWAERPELPRRPLREWQIWNEPHLDGYWHDPENTWPADYVALLREAHATIKQADPRGRVVLAALADFIWTHLRRIYRAGGEGLFDVVTSNFYTGRVGNYAKALKRIRAVMRRGGDGRMALWLTEVAWPAARGRQRRGAAWHRLWLQTDRGMARRLTQTYDRLVRERRKRRLGRVYWYTWSSGYRRGDLFDFAGLLRYNGAIFRAKPALRAYQRSARRYEGCRKGSTGRCR